MLKCRHCGGKPEDWAVEIVMPGGHTFYKTQEYIVCPDCAMNEELYERIADVAELEEHGVFTFWLDDERFFRLSELEEHIEAKGMGQLSFCRNGRGWSNPIVTVDTLDQLKESITDELAFHLAPTQEWQEREKEEMDRMDAELNEQLQANKRRRVEFESLKLMNFE